PGTPWDTPTTAPPTGTTRPAIAPTSTWPSRTGRHPRLHAKPAIQAQDHGPGAGRIAAPGSHTAPSGTSHRADHQPQATKRHQQAEARVHCATWNGSSPSAA